MKKRLLLITVPWLLMAASCNEPEFADGYQFGDVSRVTMRDVNRLIEVRNRACNYIGESGTRQVLDKIAIAAIRVYAPAYPADGICTHEFDELIMALKNMNITK